MENVIDSIPTHRIAGLKRIIAESNAFAVDNGFQTVTVECQGEPVGGLQAIFIEIEDRCRVLWCEVSGFLSDAVTGRPFKRTAESKPIY